jgi:hypothetical protein
MLERRLSRTLRFRKPRRQMGFLRSKKAFAIPVTYLILFVSLIALISVTYTFAVARISARANLIKVSVAKQNMQALDDTVHSVAWSFGASSVVYMDDCGGAFRVAANAKQLALSLVDEEAVNAVLFNSSVGEASYELEASEFDDLGLYIRGNEKAIINKTSFTMTQMYFTMRNNAQSIILRYRPLATATVIGTNDGKPVNLIRVNVINLNSSQSLNLWEKFHLKVVSLDVTTVASQYEFNSSIHSLALKASSDGTSDIVWLPVSSTPEGAIVRVEVIVSNIKLQRVEM